MGILRYMILLGIVKNMRFIRKEQIVAKICDKQINDVETISSVLHNLLQLKIEFYISIKKELNTEYRILNYPNSRIKSIQDEEEAVTLLVKYGSSFMTVRNIRFNDIDEIRAITTKNIILKTDPDASMWDLVDIDGTTENDNE